MTPPPTSKEDVATHHNSDMVDDAFKIQQLRFPLEVEIVVNHLEKHTDVQPF